MANADLSPLILLFSDDTGTLLSRLNEAKTALSRMTVEAKSSPLNGSFVALWDGLELDCKLTIVPNNLSVENRVFTSADPASFRSAISISLGEKLQGGNQIAPIWSGMLEMGAVLAEALGAACIYWSPAANLIDAAYFKTAIGEFVQGGAFPSLALVRFEILPDAIIETAGLDWFSGQEIVASHQQLPTRDAMYRLVRIAHDIAMVGPYKVDTQLEGLLDGEQLLIAPEEQLAKVDIRISSKADALLH